jgi:hypothetical protein
MNDALLVQALKGRQRSIIMDFALSGLPVCGYLFSQGNALR